MSGFESWPQKLHASKYLIYADNIGLYLSIDEVSLSKGELYTFITNKAGHGKKGTIVAIIAGTKAEDIQTVLEKICLEKRNMVQEITLDMAKNIEAGVKAAFPNAKLVTDRFHVAKLALDALQHIRVQQRWKEVDMENKMLTTIKKSKDKLNKALEKHKDDPEKISRLKENHEKYVKKHEIKDFENGDSPKQLLARSRYILAKKENQWTQNQKERAEILFNQYPHIQTAYHEVLAFRNIYEQTNKSNAKEQFLEWIQKVETQKMKPFYSVAKTVENNLENILNFFDFRNTNANAESFNSKIKLFRANQRGVVDVKFFLFRLEKLFA